MINSLNDTAVNAISLGKFIKHFTNIDSMIYDLKARISISLLITRKLVMWHIVFRYKILYSFSCKFKNVGGNFLSWNSHKHFFVV